MKFLVSGKKRRSESSSFVSSPLWCPCRHAGSASPLCALTVVALRHPEKVRSCNSVRFIQAIIPRKDGRDSRGQALQGGVRQKRPRVVQEMQRKHSERLAEDGHHGAGT